jgi:hypothetical protein
MIDRRLKLQAIPVASLFYGIIFEIPTDKIDEFSDIFTSNTHPEFEFDFVQWWEGTEGTTGYIYVEKSRQYDGRGQIEVPLEDYSKFDDKFNKIIEELELGDLPMIEAGIGWHIVADCY